MWKYCPLCGYKLSKEISTIYGVCTHCDQEWFKNSKPAVVAAILDGTKILLTRRAIDPHKGKWDFPGGFLSELETPASDSARNKRGAILQK